jgi:P2-related tail formation protein
MPFDTDPVERLLEAVGASHARAGMPVALLEAGPEIFASSPAKAVHEHGDSWNSDYTAAWRELIQQCVDIQKRSYAEPST